MVASLQAPGCGSEDEFVVADDPEFGAVETTVTLPEGHDESAVAAVHMWVLTAEEGAEAPVLCAMLVGGDLEPHDLSLHQQAEVVSNDPNAVLEDDEIEPGPALVYVEVVDFSGDVQLAGCAAVGVTVDDTRSVEVSLREARVYTCNSEAAEDGSPCSDRRFCTVGETCQDGVCRGGSERDCGHLDVGCLRGVCDEEQGCVTEPANEGDTCDDGQFCTVGETCTGGVCGGGTARDCSQDAAQCEVVIGCDEVYDQCLIDYRALGAACNDGHWCTVGDACDGYGSCQGTPRDCSTGDGQCDSGVCDEAARACVSGPVPVGSACDDGLACTRDDACDDSGSCSGTDVLCDGPCEVGPCSEPYGCGTQPEGTPCGDPDPCSGTCDAYGVCGSSPAADTTPCDDGNPDTTGDQCVDGVCIGTATGG